MTPVSSTPGHNQPRTWIAAVSPLLRHINMRTLALLMFVGFALLNTSHGKDSETKESAFTGTTNVRLIDNDHHQAAERATDSPCHTTSASSILWLFISSIVNDLERALNDPTLIEYAKKEGVDTSDLLASPCSNTSGESPTPSRSLSSQSTNPLSSY